VSNYTAGSRKTKDKPQTGDMTVNRMMVIFVAAVVYVVALLLLKKNGTSFETMFVLHALPIVRLVTGLLFAGTVIWNVVNRKRGVDESGWFFGTIHAVIAAFILFISAMLYSYVGNSGIVTGVIALTVAAFVYCFYQREFFAYTIFTLIGTLALYGVKSGWSANIFKFIASIVLIAVAFILPILTIVFATKAKKNGGVLKLGKSKFNIMKPDGMYAPFYIGSVFMLAAAVVGLVFNSIAFYAIIAFLFLYLVFAIIYTVKMI